MNTGLIGPDEQPLAHRPNKLEADLAEYGRVMVVSVYRKVMETMAARVKDGFRGIGWVGCEVINRNGCLELHWPMEFTKPNTPPQHVRPFVSYPLTDETAANLKAQAEVQKRRQEDEKQESSEAEELKGKLLELRPEGPA